MADTQTQSVKFVGNRQVVWGTDGTYENGFIVDNASVKNASDQTAIADNNGNTVLLVFFNERKECSITVLANKDATIPAAGDAITIANVANCIVTDATENWTKGAAKSISINATFYKFLEVQNG